MHSLFAPNNVTGFRPMAGLTIGIVANQPKVLAGCLDVASSEKALGSYASATPSSIPILTLLDVPGYLPGLKQEAGGIIEQARNCSTPIAKRLSRRSLWFSARPMEALIPRLQSLATDLIYALPDAEIAVMGPEAAVAVIFRRQIAEAEDPIAHKASLAAEFRTLMQALPIPHAWLRRGLASARHYPADAGSELRPPCQQDRRHTAS